MCVYECSEQSLSRKKTFFQVYSHIYHRQGEMLGPYATLLYFIHVHLTKEIYVILYRLTHWSGKVGEESDKFNKYVDRRKK